MFYNGKKTIGVFVNRAELAFQHIISGSIIETAKELDYNLAFMTSYSLRESENMYDTYERAIVDFAPVEKFDAIIVAMDTYDTPAFRKKVSSLFLERAKCPVISLREEAPDFYSVISEANDRVFDLVNHLFTEHHARNIFFMGGYEGHHDSMEREMAYRKALHEHGLPIYENSTFAGDMWKGKGEEAYQHFFQNKDHLPDAVICANDYMAKALCDACIAHGVRVPEDIQITGFDNLPESQIYSPRLTTINVDFEAMSHEAVHVADDLIHGRYRDKVTRVPAKIYYRESCCGNVSHAVEEKSGNIYRQMDKIIDRHTLQNFFFVDMDGCRSLEEMQQIIERNLFMIGNYEEFHLCLLGEGDDEQHVFTDNVSEDAFYQLGYVDGSPTKVDREKRKFKQKDLLPREVCDGRQKIFYFNMLHNRERNFGYTALSFHETWDALEFFYHDFNLTIGLALNNYFNRKQLETLLLENEKNSVTDYLTGLYNRRGLKKYIQEYWDQWVAQQEKVLFVSADLDGLKTINDQFGHEEGDYAIETIAGVLKKVVKNGTVSRTGGDEFVAVAIGVEDPEKIEEEIRERLARINSREKLPYQIDCSTGYYQKKLDGELTYDDCVRLSDYEMYAMKKRKKQGK